MNYIDLLDEMKERLAERKSADVWLKEDTANALIAQAEKVSFEADKLVMTFSDGTYLSVMQDGHCCGTVESYWMITHFGEYNHDSHISCREKSAIIL